VVRSASRVSTPAEGVLSQEIKFTPTQPAENRDPEEKPSFWEQIYAIPQDLWAYNGEKGYRIYLYEGPEGKRGPYLAMLTNPFDIEWVNQVYGGGHYQASLHDPAWKIVASIRFDIDGASKKKPPQNSQNSTAPAPATDNFQSQVLEIIRDGQRRQEEFMRSILDRDRNPAPAAAAVPAVDPNIMLRGVVDMFSGLLTKAQTPQPQMGLLEIVAIIEKFKGPDLLTVLTQAKAAGLIPAAGAGGDLVTQFRQLKEAAEVVGLGEGKGKGIGEALIEQGPAILEAGGKIIDRLQNVEATRLQTARTMREIQLQQRGTVVTPAPGAPPAGSPAANSAPQQYAPQVQPPAPGATGLDVEAPSSANAIAEAERQDAFIKGKIVEAIANGDTGGEIIDFLDRIDKTICDHFSGASVEQIVYFFSADPILKKAASLPRFKAAITEMVEELNAPDEVMPEQKVN